MIARNRWLESLPPRRIVWERLQAALEDACAQPTDDRIELVRALCDALYTKHTDPNENPNDRDDGVRQACRKLAMQLERRIPDSRFLHWLFYITVKLSANDSTRAEIDEEIEDYFRTEVMRRIDAYLDLMIQRGRLHWSEAEQISSAYYKRLLFPD